MSKTDIVLGCLAKDAATGFQGIVIQKVEQLSGNIRYALQPQSEGGTTYPDAINIDEHMLEHVGPGVSDRVTPVTLDVKIPLGSKVRDITTDFEGVATSKLTYMNGCIFYAVLPKVRKEGVLAGELPAEVYVEQARLQIIDDGVRAKVEKAPVDPQTKLRPGGPATKAVRL